jgi:hypothetical protein
MSCLFVYLLIINNINVWYRLIALGGLLMFLVTDCYMATWLHQYTDAGNTYFCLSVRFGTYPPIIVNRFACFLQFLWHLNKGRFAYNCHHLFYLLSFPCLPTHTHIYTNIPSHIYVPFSYPYCIQKTFYYNK